MVSNQSAVKVALKDEHFDYGFQYEQLLKASKIATVWDQVLDPVEPRGQYLSTTMLCNSGSCRGNITYVHM